MARVENADSPSGYENVDVAKRRNSRATDRATGAGGGETGSVGDTGPPRTTRTVTQRDGRPSPSTESALIERPFRRVPRIVPEHSTGHSRKVCWIIPESSMDHSGKFLRAFQNVPQSIPEHFLDHSSDHSGKFYGSFWKFPWVIPERSADPSGKPNTTVPVTNAHSHCSGTRRCRRQISFQNGFHARGFLAERRTAQDGEV